jgi:hypothetical protein
MLDPCSQEILHSNQFSPISIPSGTSTENTFPYFHLFIKSFS